MANKVMSGQRWVRKKREQLRRWVRRVIWQGQQGKGLDEGKESLRASAGGEYKITNKVGDEVEGGTEKVLVTVN